jgi:hypothetical protein
MSSTIKQQRQHNTTLHNNKGLTLPYLVCKPTCSTNWDLIIIANIRQTRLLTKINLLRWKSKIFGAARFPQASNGSSE